MENLIVPAEEVVYRSLIISPDTEELFFLVRKDNLGIKLRPERQMWLGFTEKELLENPRILNNGGVPKSNFIVNIKNGTVKLPTKEKKDSFKKSMKKRFPSVKKRAFRELDKEMDKIKDFIFSI